MAEQARAEVAAERPTITEGSWVHYHGSRKQLAGGIYEVARVQGDWIRLRDALGREFSTRSANVSLVVP